MPFTFTADEVLAKIGTLQLRVDQLERQLAEAQREAAALREECDRLRAAAAPRAATADGAAPASA